MKTFKTIMEDIANVTGSPNTDTGGISEPPTATPNKAKKVMLLKTTIKRKELNKNADK